MAKKETNKPASEDYSYIEEMPKPRLKKLIIRNFRCIGKIPVEIDLNDIVVLVGSNNVGKSSILKAYEVVMLDGSKGAELSLEDFPNNIVDSENYPQIELHTIVYDKRVGQKWLQETDGGELLVKEKWSWFSPGKPQRVGWNVDLGNWDERSYPFGPANIANKRRPEPHKVDAFSKPEEQAEAIKKLLMTAITERAKHLQTSDEENGYHSVIKQMMLLQNEIINETKEQIEVANEALTSLIEKVFPGYKVDFNAQPDDSVNLNLFKWNSDLKMGPVDGFQSTIDKQGSGARRTLLWSALKYIAESNRNAKKEVDSNRPHLLLIDEPEICLHPTAIREACKVLYDLPNNSNWQVMVTTHSPIFIDFSRDNTTIVRVERNAIGDVEGTTLYRPDKSKLDDDDKKNLKLLNMCDPYVAEFFFGGKVIIVEGDTEYTAFNYIKDSNNEKYKNLHIVRARGKATIVSLVKILNQFGASYSILHDSDTPRTKDGSRANPAWTNNLKILDAIKLKVDTANIRLLSSIPNFEIAYLGEDIKDDKPYNALTNLNTNEDKFLLIESLLDALVDHSSPVPENCMEWNNISQLHEHEYFINN